MPLEVKVWTSIPAQIPLIAKHPPVRFMPPAKVEVAVPKTFKELVATKLPTVEVPEIKLSP